LGVTVRPTFYSEYVLLVGLCRKEGLKRLADNVGAYLRRRSGPCVGSNVILLYFGFFAVSMPHFSGTGRLSEKDDRFA
jgi:hypothetical protein